MPLDSTSPELPERSQNANVMPPRVWLGPVLDRHRVLTTRYIEDLTAEECRHRLGIDGGTHDHDDEVLALAEAELPEERDGDISLEASLVKLVDDNRAHRPEVVAVDDLTKHDPVGDKSYFCGCAGAVLKANLIAHQATDLDVELLGDPMGGEPRRQPSWLDDHYLTASVDGLFEDRRRDSGGLPSAWLGHQDERSLLANFSGDRLEVSIDGKWI